MSQKISLKEEEQKAFQYTFQDGLWDIVIGCFLLQFAIAPLLSESLGDFWSSAVFLPFFALVFLVVWLVRKYVVTPRIGKVKFGSWRRSRLIRFNIVMFVGLCAALILGVFSALAFGKVPGWVHMASFSLILLVAFSAAAYFLDFIRLYVYGVLIALAPLVGEWLYSNMNAAHHGYPITFGTLAGLIILTGLVIFVRLLINYPPANEFAMENTSE